MQSLFFSCSANPVNTTIGLQVGASFFGLPATYSAEVSAGYSFTTSSTTQTTTWKDSTEVETETLFVERSVEVAPGTATLVYDAYQYYENVKVPYVQRLRIRAHANEDVNNVLTGEEIKTQFHFNNFEGVIEEVGSDYIEITLMGETIINGFLESTSRLEDTDPQCGGG